MRLKIKLISIFIVLNSTIYANKIDDTTKSIVKIFNIKAVPSYQYPWQTSKIKRILGSGTIINGNKILTSAHVVARARVLEVKKENNPKKYIAHIKYISHQADLIMSPQKQTT
jgi:S1-C subfamily serine protease